MIFSSDVVGSEGARVSMRYQIMGSMIRFGALSAFVTPNFNDLGHPLVLKIHGQCNGVHGTDVHVDLLADEPEVSSKRDLLRALARDPLSQTRFAIFSLQLFLTHVLGLGPVDNLLRHNTASDGVVDPDGRAASLCTGGVCSVACAYFPIEEQARRAWHGHGVLIFNSRQSLRWLQAMLQGNCQEGQERLRAWRERVLASVESQQTTSVATVPLIFGKAEAYGDFDLRCPRYSTQDRTTDGFDGSTEGDVRDLAKKKFFLATHEPVAGQDWQICFFSWSMPCFHSLPFFHVGTISVCMACDCNPWWAPRQDKVWELARADPRCAGTRRQDLPQTGNILSRLPAYLRTPPRASVCEHGTCLRRNSVREALDPGGESAVAEERTFIETYANDVCQVVERAGVHQHTSTCYKYESEKEIHWRADRCRFGFFHRVVLWCYKTVVRRGQDIQVQVQRVFARSGKDPLLPCGYELQQADLEHGVKPRRDMFTGCRGLGSSVQLMLACDRPGRILTPRFHPRETSTLIAAIPLHRGNLDYQDLRTVVENVEATSAALPASIKTMPRSKDFPVFTLFKKASPLFPGGQAVASLWACLTGRDVSALKAACRDCMWEFIPRVGRGEMSRVGDRIQTPEHLRYTRAVLTSVVESLRTAIQIGFYIVDYSCKPNVQAGKVLQHMHNGLKRLEHELEARDHVARTLRLEAAGLLHDPARVADPDAEGVKQPEMSDMEQRQDKVRRILIRLWSATNYSYLKGAPLQLLQVLTRRECFRSHRYWQIMMKRLIWSGLHSCSHVSLFTQTLL